MDTGAVAAIQDMGKQASTSSVEMAGKGAVGIDLDLDLVPQRETGMSAYEMMLSESQERMLAILKPGREADGRRVFDKWGLDAAVIGHTTDTGHLVLRHGGEVVCELPLGPLTDDAPLYDRPWTAPTPPARLAPAEIPAPTDWMETVLTLMAAWDMASKRWIWSSTTATSWPTLSKTRPPGPTPASSACMARPRPWRSPATARRAMWPPIPTRAASRRWPRPGATSPPSAPIPSPSPTT